MKFDEFFLLRSFLQYSIFVVHHLAYLQLFLLELSLGLGFGWRRSGASRSLEDGDFGLRYLCLLFGLIGFGRQIDALLLQVKQRWALRLIPGIVAFDSIVHLLRVVLESTIEDALHVGLSGWGAALAVIQATIVIILPFVVTKDVVLGVNCVGADTAGLRIDDKVLIVLVIMKRAEIGVAPFNPRLR